MPVLLLAVLLACAHTVEVVSAPAGATLQVGKKRVGTAPARVELRTFGPRRLTARLPGYRTMRVKLRPSDREVELRMIAEHGGVGTWEPEDVR